MGLVNNLKLMGGDESILEILYLFDLREKPNKASKSLENIQTDTEL